MRTMLERIVAAAKADAWNKARGGFAVYRLSNGDVAYFHAGETPNIAGEPDRAAELLGRWKWNHIRWSQTFARHNGQGETKMTTVKELMRQGLTEAEALDHIQGERYSWECEAEVLKLPTIEERYGADVAWNIKDAPTAAAAAGHTTITPVEYRKYASELSAFEPARYSITDMFGRTMMYAVVTMTADEWRAFWRQRTYGEQAS